MIFIDDSEHEPSLASSVTAYVLTLQLATKVMSPVLPLGIEVIEEPPLVQPVKVYPVLVGLAKVMVDDLSYRNYSPTNIFI